MAPLHLVSSYDQPRLKVVEIAFFRELIVEYPYQVKDSTLGLGHGHFLKDLFPSQVAIFRLHGLPPLVGESIALQGTEMRWWVILELTSMELVGNAFPYFGVE